MLRIAVIAACGLAVLAVSLARNRPMTGDVIHGRASAAGVAAIRAPAASHVALDDRRPSIQPGAAPEPESLSEADTTDLLQPPLTIDQLLDELNSDLGAGAVRVEREEVVGLLSRDPELRKFLVD